MIGKILLQSVHDYKCGEIALREEHNASLVDPSSKSQNGLLMLTNYRLLFWPYNNSNFVTKSHFYEIPNNVKDYKALDLNLPIGFIQEYEKVDGNTLNIKCKDFRFVSLRLKNESNSNDPFHKVLEKNMNPRSENIRLFAFVHFESSMHREPGYSSTVLTDEFQRQLIESNNWKISKVNHNFEVCETYPDEVAVPKDVTDEQIINACQFRTKNRFPVLCWIHPDTKATLTRSSQPATGLTWKRNEGDERFLKSIKDANAYNNLLTIIDARPMINARANMARGGGIESQNVYTSISYDFLNIPNIHVMRESMRKLADLCYPKPDNNNWHKALEETKWLNYIRQILLGSLMVAEKINSQRSVLVHCSDGWDRTAQITSLPQLMLDPYFRTIRGFQTLVDKEWLLMGHKISQRTGGITEETGGSTSSTSQKSERAPIFLQFVDCVWQMTQQFLAAFEFNEQFLIDLMDAVYSGLYGNFLFNCEQQRRVNEVYTKTLSFWDHVNANLDQYRNPLYTPADESGHRVLFPQYRLPCIRFWNGYYLRHHWPTRRQDPIADYSRILYHHKRIFQTQLNRQPESDEEVANTCITHVAGGAGAGDARKI